MEHFVFSTFVKHRLVVVLIAVLMISSCKDFIEEDLTDDYVTILTPQDNFTTTSATLFFYWEKIEGALKYHIQIVKPSFASMTSLLVDTLVSGTSFSYVFTPGSYQWRIRAENGASETPYTTRSFQIDSTLDLTGQQIILLGPANDYADSNSTTTFNWYGLYNATQYTWTLKNYTGTFTGSVAMPDQTVTDTFVTVSSITEGRYDWGIRAENGFSNSNYTYRSIWIDLTNPGTPSLTSPVTSYSYPSNQFSLAWARVADSGSPLYDSVLIYSDSGLSNLVKSLYSASQTWIDTLSAGTYYWRVRTIDKAGNKSGYSSSRSFILN
ncbi:MAG: hypothetical protein ACHQF2_05215 [Flavobacteriales bacterium]